MHYLYLKMTYSATKATLSCRSHLHDAQTAWCHGFDAHSDTWHQKSSYPPIHNHCDTHHTHLKNTDDTIQHDTVRITGIDPYL